MASVIVRQGQLEKQAGKSFMGMAPWRDRWVVLTNDELTYYASNKAGEEVRGTHPLSNIRGAVENTKKRPWGFRLETADGKDQWEVGCGSKEDRDGWIQAINTTVHGNHADGALQHSPSMIEGNAFGNKVTKEDFELVGVIGQGSFAKVVEVQKIDTGKTFAMKVLKKKTVVERGQVDHTMSERAALQQFQGHPFIVNLHYAFQTRDKLYFVLDFCPGGELFYHLKQLGKFSQNRTRQYVGEISSALDFMHQLGVIYRDLKPENLLIDEDGHMKLADFGLCKRTVSAEGANKATTFCGTPEYIAPEILLGQDRRSYGKEVDWWALGTLLYEMLSGLPPFYDKNVNQMYRKILKEPLRQHARVPAAAFDLVSKFLVRKPDERLGSGPNDFADIQSHAFFESVDWDALNRREHPVEWVPSQQQQYVDGCFTQIPIGSDAGPSAIAATMDRSGFDGFTFQAAGMNATEQ